MKRASRFLHHAFMRRKIDCRYHLEDQTYPLPEVPVSETRSATPASRRDFLRRGAAAAIVFPAVVSSLGSCAETKAASVSVSASDTLPPGDPVAARRAQADAMDAMHEKGVKAFPAKTEGKGNQLLPPRMENG